MYTQANTLLLKQIEFNSNQHSIRFLKAMKLSSTSSSAQYVFPIKSIWTKWNIFIIDNTVLLKTNSQVATLHTGHLVLELLGPSRVPKLCVLLFVLFGEDSKRTYLGWGKKIISKILKNAFQGIWKLKWNFPW